MAEQTEIGYEGKEWKSYQTGGTLIRATDLNNMEGGIADACNGVDELRTKRLPTYVVAQDGDTATQDVYTEDILGPCLILDLATRTTYYETGGDEEGHRKAITSGADIDELRDSLSQKVDLFVDESGSMQVYAKPGERMVYAMLAEYRHASSIPANSQSQIFEVPESYRPTRLAEGVIIDNNGAASVLCIGLTDYSHIEIRTLNNGIGAMLQMRGFVCWPY